MNTTCPSAVLITGASGFVGRAVSADLSKVGDFTVREALRTAGTSPTTVTEQVSIGDISGSTDWSAALTGVDVVIHLAARVHVMHETSTNPLDEFRRVNVDGTLALARQAADADVQRFIYLSSVKVNGESGFFSEADIPAPSDPYGVSKYEAEIGLRALAEKSKMAIVIIRPPLVYGPGVKANFRALMSAVQKNIPLPLGAIHNKRSLVSLGNLVSLIRTVISHPLAANETFFVSDGCDLSTTELIRSMAKALDRKPLLLPVPAVVLTTLASMVGKRAMADRLFGSLQVDSGKARRLLGWTPPLTVAEGLQSVMR